MIVGGAAARQHPLMLAAVLAMGGTDLFGRSNGDPSSAPAFGEVLGGTGPVEAGTSPSGRGRSSPGSLPTIRFGVAATIGIAILGLIAGCQVPPAPPAAERVKPDWHIIRASIRLVNETMHIPRLFLAILAISFFWTIGAVLIIIFPPLVKNVLGADEQVASLFIAIFSIGIAIGSVLINRL
jgi:hypothetical protein